MRGVFAIAMSLTRVCTIAAVVALIGWAPSLTHRTDAGSNREASNIPGAVYSVQASVIPSAAASGVDAGHQLGAGDKVRISVSNQRDLTDIYQVDGLGRITFPRVGQIKAGGLIPKQLELKIARALSPDYVKTPHVSVVVLNDRSFSTSWVKSQGRAPILTFRV
jgi:protein involved in polysaccharide export with SLBB domain